MQKFCTILSVVQLVAVSLATVTSSFVIESILGSGVVCMIIALIAFVVSLRAKRYYLTVISLTTLLVGIFFIVFELIFYGFGGPEKAALPMCVLFLGVQAFSISATVADLNGRPNGPSELTMQISLKQLLIGSAIFAISFGIMENFPANIVPRISDWSVAFRYKWLISLSLAMFFLSMSGLFMFWKSSRTQTVEKASKN